MIKRMILDFQTMIKNFGGVFVDILTIILLSLGSLIALFILTKLMGYRQMSEMSMFDYINGITIGSIAAEMATSLEKTGGCL